MLLQFFMKGVDMALTKRQLTAIDELFLSSGDELAVQEKLNIERYEWQKLLGNNNFVNEINQRRKSLDRQTQILLAKYKPIALAVLISLCQSSSEETSRKACAELLSLNFNDENEDELAEPEEPKMKLDPETAAKVWEVLAQARQAKNKQINAQQSNHGGNND
jgi:hypothetical protein